MTRQPRTLTHAIMHGDVEGWQNRGWLRHTWLADIRKWTGQSNINNIRAAEKWEHWTKRVMTSKCPNGHQATGITWTWTCMACQCHHVMLSGCPGTGFEEFPDVYLCGGGHHPVTGVQGASSPEKVQNLSDKCFLVTYWLKSRTSH